jgi:hypothetical protein
MRIQRRQSTHPSLHLLNNFKRQSTQNSNKRKKKKAAQNNHTVKADARLWITCAGKENIGIPGTVRIYSFLFFFLEIVSNIRVPAVLRREGSNDTTTSDDCIPLDRDEVSLVKKKCISVCCLLFFSLIGLVFHWKCQRKQFLYP